MRRSSSPRHGPRRRAKSSPTRKNSSATSIRSMPTAPQDRGGGRDIPQTAGQFPLALARPVLCRTEPAELHVPAAASQRHPQPLAVAGLARLAATHGGGYAHVTTRANFQIREIPAERAPSLIEAIQDWGLWTRGSGADNVRNVTGTPTAGIDPQELIDTRPYARAWHFHILNTRTLYGLPRKFNVAFDGGGAIAALEDTNDIGFQAVEVVEGDRRRARRLVPPAARRHHRPQGFRPRHRRFSQTRRFDGDRRCDRPNLHRPR